MGFANCGAGYWSYQQTLLTKTIILITLGYVMHVEEIQILAV